MEIDKELRLPVGIKSWWELLHIIPFQDELPIHQQTQNIKFYKHHEWTQNNNHTSEVFECDVLTLKARGFDELKEIIPGKEDLINMYHEVRYLSGNLGSEKTCDFLLKLIELT